MNLNNEELKKILPNNGPALEEVQKYITKYKNDLIVIKYGGNVFIDRNIFNNFISDLSILKQLEEESIYIIREVAGQFDGPCLLLSLIHI